MPLPQDWSAANRERNVSGAECLPRDGAEIGETLMVRFGVFLPAYVYPGEEPPTASTLQTYARAAEELGFDSVWLFDHLLEAAPSYKVSFLEPATTLALAA